MPTHAAPESAQVSASGCSASGLGTHEVSSFIKASCISAHAAHCWLPLGPWALGTHAGGLVGRVHPVQRRAGPGSGIWLLGQRIPWSWDGNASPTRRGRAGRGPAEGLQVWPAGWYGYGEDALRQGLTQCLAQTRHSMKSRCSVFVDSRVRGIGLGLSTLP